MQYLSPQNKRIILDAKLEDALLESFACMAEIVDLKLYQELGYATAKEYFEKKSLTVAQVYRFATIGREIAPQLQDSKFKKEVAQLGVGKLEILARKAEGSLPALMQGNTITHSSLECSVIIEAISAHRQCSDAHCRKGWLKRVFLETGTTIFGFL